MIRKETEFDRRLDAFDEDMRRIAFDYAARREECLKRHLWPPYLDRLFLHGLANLTAEQACRLAESHYEWVKTSARVASAKATGDTTHG